MAGTPTEYHVCGSAWRPKKLLVKKRCPTEKGEFLSVVRQLNWVTNQSIDYVKGTFSRVGDDQKN